jgi:superfamily II DNA or RNA helicase
MDLDQLLARTAVSPRPYQQRIVQQVSDAYQGKSISRQGGSESAVRSILIESPTGSGKTVMGLLAARFLQEQHPDLAVGWVAMRRNLLLQAEREHERHRIAVRDLHFVSMFDKQPTQLQATREGGRKLLLVVDEAQHDAAGSCMHLHNLLRPDWILGLSATPYRVDRLKLCFEKVIRDAGIHRLIQDGYLAPYHHFTIPRWTPQEVASHYAREPQRWGKSIFYFANLRECFQVQQALGELGHSAEVVTGASDCEQQLDRFRQTELNCLVSCMKLTEGFDEPALKTAWVRDSSRGPTIQMGGRVFRQHPNLRWKQIVQSAETRWPMMRTAMPAAQFVWMDDSWRSLQVNEQINEISTAILRSLAQSEVKLPAFLLKKGASTSSQRRNRENFSNSSGSN